MTEPRSLPDVGDLLGHRGPARFVASILELSEAAIVCAGSIPADSAFVECGQVPSFVLIDFAAQAAALLEALGRSRGGALPQEVPGYLVQVRQLRCSRTTVLAGEPLVARVAREREAPPLFVYRISVESAGAEVLSGSISTFAELRPDPRAA